MVWSAINQRKTSTIGEDREKHKQNKQGINTRYGDRQSALGGVRGQPGHIGVCPFRECERAEDDHNYVRRTGRGATRRLFNFTLNQDRTKP